MTSRTFIPDAPLLDEQGRITTPWLQVFRIWGVSIMADRQSGSTAERPTSGLWVGRSYYDLSLGKPIWVHTVDPVMWHDGAGNLV